MKSSPILFSDPMVRAIRAGNKTQTRRIVKPSFGKKHPILNLREHGLTGENCSGEFNDPRSWGYPFVEDGNDIDLYSWSNILSRLGKLGDELWVKECFGKLKNGIGKSLIYRADGGWANAKNIRDLLEGGKWKPSIFCGREQSRIRLELTAEPRIERLGDITEKDALEEGADFHDGNGIGNSGYRHDENDDFVFQTAKQSYQRLWNKINSKPGERWEDNPWVWVYTFKEKK